MHPRDLPDAYRPTEKAIRLRAAGIFHRREVDAIRDGLDFNLMAERHGAYVEAKIALEDEAIGRLRSDALAEDVIRGARIERVEQPALAAARDAVVLAHSRPLTVNNRAEVEEAERHLRHVVASLEAA